MLALGSRLAIAALAAGLALTATGCSREDGSSPIPGLSKPKSDADLVVARINGRGLTMADVRAAAQERGLVSGNQVFDADSPGFDQLVDELIDRRLLSIEAEAKGLDADSAIKARMQAAREVILNEALLQSLVNAEVSEEALRKFYQEQVAIQEGRSRGSEYKIRQITLKSEAAALDTKDRLDQGEDFSTVAFEVSTDAARMDGGSRGFLTLAQLPEDVSRSLDRSKPGSRIGPIKVGDNWVLYLFEEKRDLKVMTFEEMRPLLRQNMMFTEVQTVLERLCGTARVEKLTGTDKHYRCKPDVTQPAGATSAAEPAAAGEPVEETQSEPADAPGAPASAAAPTQAPPAKAPAQKPAPAPRPAAKKEAPAPSPAPTAPAKPQPAAPTEDRG
jgi:peptidyl-prolyl cis-trans isomerase C